MTASLTAVWWGGAPVDDQIADAHLLAAVDEALSGSGAEAELVCTHVDGSAPAPRVGVSIRLTAEPADPAATRSALARALAGPVVAGDTDDAEVVGPARTALLEAGAAEAGRAVRFPGSASVTGRVSVADLIATTAIDQVVGIGVEPAGTDVVDTGPNGFLRPRFSGGRLTLLVERAAGGVLQPFEIEDPHQCCEGGGH
ncbi:hypothetical protein O2W15_18205 [Modestobacter sp. VKM Ac-2979]|uniref:hypothetical protein n=1 Tax=unclassified Modestobacter TaxID=2643866 RepID=UPI0022AB56DE|nr:MULTISPECIES: hypothetical protein [unclassified Modestobacter]MCZ2813368.1 hypothetical protein [Modestobacter sp. VKM Ac-2979]MCZ2842440.1 hypothetical protein [Modestobacter sp. VKM Ac-2980]